jgi:hypothetical protein
MRVRNVVETAKIHGIKTLKVDEPFFENGYKDFLSLIRGNDQVYPGGK